MPDFGIGESDFLLDRQPFRILSGALHYFRVHPDSWADRIEKARLMGLNTIETYVPWNAHSPSPGEFRTDGMLDLPRFLRTVRDAGMYAIVRPGPFICAEWDRGGLPSWLFRDPNVGIRRDEKRFLALVGEYLDQVLDVLVPLQVHRGGPVLLVQVENEYGAFGDDRAYLQAIADVIRRRVRVPLVTVDQPVDHMLANGGLDDVLRTASFGSRSEERLRTLRRHQPTGPLMCMEFWDGWFDQWGGHHNTTPVEQAAAELDVLLAAGASVNVYMFHGGTNFGLNSGANDKGTYRPTVTSYDYDAPLDEAGNPTPKYFAFRDVISRYAKVPDETPAGARPAPETTAALSDPVPLLPDPDAWGARTAHDLAPSLDELEDCPKLAVYRTQLDGPDEPALLTVGEVRDRALVFLDGGPVGVLEREHHQTALMLPRGRGRLELVVEDQGGVNYGPRIGEPKGLIGPVRLGERELTGWSVWAVDLDDLPQLWDRSRERGTVPGPTAWRGSFEAERSENHFLDTTGWGKGIAWVNGFCLGRYWRRGPQETLYVPAPVVREGTNELVVLELDVMPEPTARFVPGPSLGPLEP